MSVELEIEMAALRREIQAFRKVLESTQLLPSKGTQRGAPNPNELTEIVKTLQHSVDLFSQIPALRRSNHHQIIELDLTVGRTAVPVWTASDDWNGIPASNLTIFAVPSAFTYAINAVGNKFLDATKGDSIENEDIYVIYVTNSAGTGTGKIRVAGWIPPPKKKGRASEWISGLKKKLQPTPPKQTL